MVSVMPHQPMVLIPNAENAGGSQTAVPHILNLCCLGISCSSSAFMQNGMVEVQVLPCSAPEAAGGKPWLYYASRAHPKAREHRIGQRVGMKQRQIGLMYIVLMQVLMRRVDLA